MIKYVIFNVVDLMLSNRTHPRLLAEQIFEKIAQLYWCYLDVLYDGLSSLG